MIRRGRSLVVLTVLAGQVLLDLRIEAPAQPLGGAPAEQRTALVIGNSAYSVGGSLANPLNDARAMAATLSSLGFSVTRVENAARREMLRAVHDFGEALAGGRGVALFYYAGHGLQADGKNYMIPVDATIRHERDIDIEAVDVGRVLAELDRARNRLNIVVLDACRDNPYVRGFRSAGGRGLAAIEAPKGTLIAYATAPGKTADDGPGPNSLYTRELLRAMVIPGLRIEDVFKRVRTEVARRTRDRQVPWESSSLVGGDFVFAPHPAREAVTSLAPEPRVQRVPRVGSLLIRATEPVEVWLGARSLGEAAPGIDLIVENLAAGMHAVRARPRRADARPWDGTVEVEAQRQATVVIQPEPAAALSRPEAGPGRPGSGSPAPSVPEPRPPGVFAGVWEGSIKFSGGGYYGGVARLELTGGDDRALTGTFTLLDYAGLDLLARELVPGRSVPISELPVSGRTVSFSVGQFAAELTVSADHRRVRGWLTNTAAPGRPAYYLDLERRTPLTARWAAAFIASRAGVLRRTRSSGGGRARWRRRSRRSGSRRPAPWGCGASDRPGRAWPGPAPGPRPPPGGPAAGAPGRR
jgi:hypothetical protein